MAFGFDSTGYTPKTAEELVEDAQADLRANVTPTPDLGDASPLGQHTVANATQAAFVHQAIQALVSAQDPAQAEGIELDTIVARAGVTREPAQFEQVSLNINLDAGTYSAGTLRVAIVGNPDVVFANQAAISGHAGGALNGVLFEAEEAGPVSAPIGTVTVVLAPPELNTATNPAPSTGGTLLESDFALYTRWRASLSTGSGTVNAITKALLSISATSYVKVLENDTTATVDGITAHGVEAVVEGGTNQEVADAIYASKSAGCTTSGSVTQAVVAADGSSKDMKFSRPTTVDMLVTVNASYLTKDYPLASDLEGLITTNVETIFDDEQTVGRDVFPSRFVSKLFRELSLVDVAVLVAEDPGSPAATPVSIDRRSKAVLASGGLTINLTALTEEP